MSFDAAAQGSRPEVQAHRLAEGDSIVVDGIPGEAAWQKATPATDFRQRDPDNGEPATERTGVRIIFDKDRIVLGVTCFDSEPGKLLGNQMQRDQPFSGDDRFLWAIDPFLDGRSGYFFEINPAGAMGDGLITGPTGGGGGGNFGGQMNKSWDGIWLARVRRSGLGWSAEIEIPFKTLNFDPDAAAWGANFQRTVKRKNEESLWTGWLRTEGLTKMSNAGRLGGIRDISQGIGLDLKPYLLGAAGNAPGRGRAQTDRDVDIGLDAFYNVTPALKANFTVNTDFAETEVDERRTNLTRFPLFFPEKRGFFLDGASFFAFPPGDTSPLDLNLNLDNQLVDRNVEFTPLEIEFHSGDGAQFNYRKQTEQLDEDFEIADGVLPPIGNRRCAFAGFRNRGMTCSSSGRKTGAMKISAASGRWTDAAPRRSSEQSVSRENHPRKLRNTETQIRSLKANTKNTKKSLFCVSVFPYEVFTARTSRRRSPCRRSSPGRRARA